MSHNLFKSDWMFSAIEKPWHGIGTVTTGALSASAALKAAKLDWTTGKEQIYRFRPPVGSDFDSMSPQMRDLVHQIQELNANESNPIDIGFLKAVKGWSATVRDDLGWDHSARLLGVVGESYQPIANEACFDLVDRVVGGMGASYETAGSLRNGKQVFLLAKCPNDLQILDDKIRPYLLLSTAHDGSGALEVKLTLVRVVCNNTLSVAIADQSTATVRVKHTKGNVDGSGKVVAGVVSDVRNGVNQKVVQSATGDSTASMISQAHDFINSQMALFNRLADTEISAQFAKDYLACLIPEPITGNPTRALNRRRQIHDIYFGTQPGDFDPRKPGSKQQQAIRIDRETGTSTAYRMLNALTHFNDHCAISRQTSDKVTGEKKTEAEARFTRIFDSGAQCMREAGTRLLIEGIDTNGKNFREALAKARDLKQEHHNREAVLAGMN